MIGFITAEAPVLMEEDVDAFDSFDVRRLLPVGATKYIDWCWYCWY